MAASGVKTPPQQRQTVVKSAAYFAFGTLSSRLLGLLRDAFLLAIFTTTLTDAWFTAFRLPNIFRRLFGEGAFSACFLPTYIDYRERDQQAARAELTAGILGLLLVVLTPASILAIYFMDSLMELWLQEKGFSEIPGKMEITISMAKIMFPFLPLMSGFAFIMAVLNAHKKFLITSLAPCFFNLVIICVCVWKYMGASISPVVLAWAVIVGGFAQIAVMLPAFLKLKVPFDWKLSALSSAPVKRVIYIFLPTVFGIGIIQLMTLVNTYFASGLAEGAITYIYTADRLLELPLSLISVSMGTALLPTLSEAVGASDFKKFEHVFVTNLKISLFLCLPAAIGLWMLAEPLTRLMFERGQFSSGDSLQVAQVVRVYAFTLLGASVTRIFTQAFYAEKNTHTPAWGAFWALLIHLMMAPWWMQHYGLEGLVVSTCFATFVNCLYLAVKYKLRYRDFSSMRIIYYVLRCTVAGVGIVVVCLGVNWLTTQFAPSLSYWGVNLVLLVEVLVCVFMSAVVYFLVASSLRIEESSAVLGLVRRKLRQ